MSDLFGGLISGIGSIIGGVGGAAIQSHTDKEVNAANLKHADKWNAINQSNWQSEFDYSKAFNEKQFSASREDSSWQKQFEQSQFDYQKYLAENANQIRVADLEKAGLNPVLAAGSGTLNASPVSSGLTSPSGWNPSGGGKPASQSANQRSSNIGAIISQAISDGAYAGAMFDLQSRSVAAESRLKDAQTSYYNALAGSIPEQLDVSKRGAAVGETNATTNRMAVEQQAPLVEANTALAKARTGHELALTDQALYQLKTLAPAQYQSMLLDNRIKEGQIKAQQRDAMLGQLNLILQEGEIQMQKTRIDKLQSELTAQEMQNALTQVSLDIFAAGLNPKDLDGQRVYNWVEDTFVGMSDAQKSRITSWINLVYSKLGVRINF